jgi:hypothetical protein
MKKTDFINFYPVSLDIDYPETSCRITVFFRIFLAIPVGLLLATLMNSQLITILIQNPSFFDVHNSHMYGKEIVTIGGGALCLPPLLAILFRKFYPTWWFNWNVEFTRFILRITAYLYFLQDEYPALEKEQSVHYNVIKPTPDDLMRGLPLIKWLLASPHFIILSVLYFVAIPLWFITWACIVFTGRYPRPLFNYFVGLMRYNACVYGYAILLFTDQYPSFTGHFKQSTS